MRKEEKALIIDELAEKFQNNNVFYITDASGLSVAQVNALRRMCFEKGVEYQVVKNTLIKKALERVDADFSAFDNGVLKGFSGVMFTAETGNLPARLIKEFKRTQDKDKLKLKAASIYYDLFVGDDQLAALVDLKSKNELIGDIIGLLQSPAKNVVSALQSGKNTLAGLVKTLSEREN
jgi:large subunit ribosomal protein L10